MFQYSLKLAKRLREGEYGVVNKVSDENLTFYLQCPNGSLLHVSTLSSDSVPSQIQFCHALDGIKHEM